VEGGGWRVEGGGWRVEGGGWRVEGGGWRVRIEIELDEGQHEGVAGLAAGQGIAEIDAGLCEGAFEVVPVGVVTGEGCDESG
jgi:hypothetical protein